MLRRPLAPYHGSPLQTCRSSCSCPAGGADARRGCGHWDTRTGSSTWPPRAPTGRICTTRCCSARAWSQINSPIKSCRSAAGPRGSTTQGAAMASGSASTRSPRALGSPAVLLRLLLPEHSKAAAVLVQSCRRFRVCDSKHTRLSVREHQFLLPAELSHCTPSRRAVGTESPAPARK